MKRLLILSFMRISFALQALAYNYTAYIFQQYQRKRVYRMHASVAQVVLAAAGLALAAAPSFAEKPAKFENAVLYSNLRSASPREESFHSYRLIYTAFVNRHFGLGGDVILAGGSNLDFLFGPEIGLLDKDRVGIRLHARAGPVRRLYRDPIRRTDTIRWNFASAIGSSVDVYWLKGWAWRVVQPEIVWWRRGGGNHTEFRLSTGVVLRFGETR